MMNLTPPLPAVPTDNALTYALTLLSVAADPSGWIKLLVRSPRSMPPLPSTTPRLPRLRRLRPRRKQ